MAVKKAFTLAEVLITLGIIGVVAAMTIPTLINNIQDMQYKSAYKKIFSNLANVMNQTANDYAGDISSIISSDDDSLKAIFDPHLLKVNTCAGGASVGACWHAFTGWKLLNNSLPTNNMGGENHFADSDGAGNVLPDGALVRYMAHDTCSTMGANNCGYILVDVNGFNKPNTLGRDIYAIHVNINKIEPFGLNDANANTCTSSGTGFGCAAEYLYK